MISEINVYDSFSVQTFINTRVRSNCKENSVFTNTVEYMFLQKRKSDILLNLKHYEDMNSKDKSKRGFYGFKDITLHARSSFVRSCFSSIFALKY